jgi:hypothetical protein
MGEVVGADAGGGVRSKSARNANFGWRILEGAWTFSSLTMARIGSAASTMAEILLSQILSFLLFSLVAFNALCHLKGKGRLGSGFSWACWRSRTGNNVWSGGFCVS